MAEIGTYSIHEGGGAYITMSKMREGRENCTPSFLDSLILNEPEIVKNQF